MRAAPLSTWALFGAGIAISAMQMALVVIIWAGKWPAGMEHEQLLYIGVLAIMLAIDLMAVIASLARARVAANLPGGVKIDLGSGGLEQPAQASVTADIRVPQ